METLAGSTNNLRRTDSNLSMMTDDSSSEIHHVGHHHQADPPAIATNGTGNQDDKVTEFTIIFPNKNVFKVTQYRTEVVPSGQKGEAKKVCKNRLNLAVFERILEGILNLAIFGH